MKKKLSALGIQIYKGQKIKGTENAPLYFFKSNIFKNFKSEKISLSLSRIELFESLRFTKYYIQNNINQNNFNLFVGGDHSISLATISGLLGMNKAKDYAIIWIDAHPDINIPKTSPSNNLHGMSVSGLLGRLNKPYNIFSCLNKDQIMFIGIRSIDSGEKEYINKNKIKVLDMDTINNNDSNYTTKEINNFIKNKKVHISFDVDAIDPKLISSTGTPVENGLTLKQINNIFDTLSNHKVKSMDLVEFNPNLGDKIKSFDIINKILGRFLGKIFRRPFQL